MRLFGLVDAAIDRRDRAQWLTPPFDRRLASGIAGPYRVAAAEPQSVTAVCGQARTSGDSAYLARCV